MSGAIRRTLAMAAAICSIFGSSVSYADAGTGPYPRRADVLKASHVPALGKIGEDVIRFSSTPALGGRGVIIEIHRRDAQWSTGTMTLLIGHPSARWVTTAMLTIEMNTSQFEALTSEIDRQLLRGEPPLENAKDEIVACTDGPGYVTERLSDGRSRWLSGFCGDHPNNRIAELISPIAAGSFGRWLPDFIRSRSEPHQPQP